MSETPDSRSEHEDLEALLKGLAPSSLDVGFITELERARKRLEVQREHSPARMQWARVVPLLLLCLVTTFVFALYRYGDRLAEGRDARIAHPEGSPSLASSEEERAPGSVPNFLPVSTHGTILNTSAGGLIETDEGMRQRLQVEIQDAYHWHDPESGTNIRFFRPRSEEFLVPLPRD